MTRVEALAAGAVAIILTTTPAWAGNAPASPAPLVGAGIPAMAGLAYLYRRIRKSRDR